MSLDRASSVPIHRQLYEQVREAILDGRLMPGARVPPTRELAHHFGLARTTVMTAYDNLVGDGYLESRVGAWTSVAEHPPHTCDVRLDLRPAPAGHTPRVDTAAKWLERRSVAHGNLLEYRGVYNFSGLVTPAVDQFPADEWRQLVARRWRELTPVSLVTFEEAGDAELRQAIRQHVRSTRGIECEVDQIHVTTGSEQAVSIMAQVALEPGDGIAVEDPSLVTIQNAFRACGAVLAPIPLDADGLRVDALPTIRGCPPALVYTTPTYQLPTGAVLPRSRRLRLLDWAVANQALIIEDDCDSDLCYDRPAPESLYTLDDHGVVIYLGTFSRILNPSIQIGFMIVPVALADAVGAAHRVIARQTEVINQSALAKFIRSGSFARHLRRLRRVHTVRRDCLIRRLRDAFGDEVEIGPVGAGLHAHVSWPSCELSWEILSRVRAAGVSMRLVRPMCIAPVERDPGVVLAYAGLTEQQIEDGVQALAKALDLA
jgi:GntR family transcriptional regulator/MocR family aminotransferase